MLARGEQEFCTVTEDGGSTFLRNYKVSQP